MSSVEKDLTARARIREAAIVTCGEVGVERATMRLIAAQADVSPALIVHHFGSKEGLLAACDDHILATLATEKGALLLGGLSMPVGQYLDEHPEYLAMSAYIYAVLRAGGEPAQVLFDRICTLTEDILRAGVDAGTIRPTGVERSRSAVMVAMSLGFGVLSPLLAMRVSGSPHFDADALVACTDPVMDLYNHGLFATEFQIPQEGQ